MIGLHFRPISHWPRERTPAAKRAKARFDAPYIGVLNHLERELRHLGAKDIVVEAGFREGDIRNDGWPYAGRNPGDPGIILGFTSKHGPLRIPCDHFRDYQQNLRAIGLHLEHLRLASAYGVGEYGEQYKGWERLEAGTPAVNRPLTVEESADIIAANSSFTTGTLIEDEECYLSARKQAMARTHPDVSRDRGRWDIVQRARAVLDAHHGIAKGAS